MWSIGIYSGDSPFRLMPAAEAANPVLCRRHIFDVDASYIADPFMIRRQSRWYMFFEIKNHRDRKGVIGLATSDTGVAWTYRGVVLDGACHLSYPHVFIWRGDVYMVPETLGLDGVHLYRAERFPDRWSRAGELLSGSFADPSIFRFDGRWWLFACPRPFDHDALRLFFADRLHGPWTEHPRSPVVAGDRRAARPAGRVVVWGQRVIRFAQDCYPTYGRGVRAFEMTALDPRDYREREHHHSPILEASGEGWNQTGMHHVDLHQLAAGRWLACVDGTRTDDVAS